MKGIKIASLVQKLQRGRFYLVVELHREGLRLQPVQQALKKIISDNKVLHILLKPRLLKNSWLKLFRNGKSSFFWSPKLCLCSMCGAKSAWLHSLCGAKSALLPSIYIANLQCNADFAPHMVGMKTLLCIWSRDIVSLTKNWLTSQLFELF